MDAAMIEVSITVRVGDGERITERAAFDPVILRDPSLIVDVVDTTLDHIWRRSMKPSLVKQINAKAGL